MRGAVSRYSPERFPAFEPFSLSPTRTATGVFSTRSLGDILIARVLRSVPPMHRRSPASPRPRAAPSSLRLPDHAANRVGVRSRKLGNQCSQAVRRHEATRTSRRQPGPRDEPIWHRSRSSIAEDAAAYPRGRTRSRSRHTTASNRPRRTTGRGEGETGSER
jgi:hypothetical protein